MFSTKNHSIEDLPVPAKALTEAEAEKIQGGVMQDPVTGRTCTDPPYPKPILFPYPKPTYPYPTF